MKDDSSWIIDSGATSHMCPTLSIFQEYKPVKTKQLVVLPNGKNQSVSHIGNILLFYSLQLKHVLHLPAFKYKLLSVSQLLRDSKTAFIFYSKHCCLQEMRTKKLIVVGKCAGGLYRLTKDSFDKRALQEYIT